MKHLAIAVLLLLATASVYGQSATLASPIQPAQRASLRVGAFHFSGAVPNDPNTQATASCDLWLMDSDGNRADVWTVQMVGTEANQFVVALVTPATGETGTVARKINFRILKYLHDNCASFQTPCLAQFAGSTVAP